MEAGGHEVLVVLPARQKQTVVAFLTSVPFQIRAQIERVYTDMYKGFTYAVQACLPWAKLVIDRFHVAKAYRAQTRDQTTQTIVIAA